MRMVKMLSLLLLSTLTLTQPLQAIEQPTPPRIDATAYVLMDAETGKILASSNAKKQLPPASLTKILTSYVLSEMIQQESISPNQAVSISKNAWSKNFQDSSKMFIEVGKTVSVEQLHKGIVISSGNDACVAIAEHISGSIEGFADLMNATAKRLGMQNSQFKNPHGLDEVGHYSSAYDIALLSRALIKNMPEFYSTYAEKSFTYNGITQYNRNTLLWDTAMQVDGIKTGHVSSIGYNLATSATLPNQKMRLIAVVLGAKSENARSQETKKLLSWGFNHFATITPYQIGTELTQQRVWFGENKQVKLGVNAATTIVLLKTKIEQLKASYVLNTKLSAPLAQGQKVGEIIFEVDKEKVATFPLVTLENIQTGSLSGRFRDHVALFFKKITS